MTFDPEDEARGLVSYHNTHIMASPGNNSAIAQGAFFFNHEHTGVFLNLSGQEKVTRGTNTDHAAQAAHTAQTSQTSQLPKTGEFNTKKSNGMESKPVDPAISSMPNIPKVVIPGLTLLQDAERRSQSEGRAWGGQAAPRPAMIQNEAQTWEDFYETETEASQNPLKRVRTAPAMQLNSPRSEDAASPPSLSLSDMLQVDLATAQQLKREQQRRSRRDA